MKTVQAADLIEIKGPENSIDIREVFCVLADDGTVVTRSFRRYGRGDKCRRSDHPLAKALRRAVPYISRDPKAPRFSSDGIYLEPDSIRIQVKSGIIRINYNMFVVSGGKILSRERKPPFIIYPDVGVRSFDEKVQAVCDIVHTPDVIKTWNETLSVSE